MRIVVRQAADEDLDSIFAWIAQDSPAAALDVIRRLRARIGQLAWPGLAYIGRPGRDPGTRELIEAPYIIVYEVHETDAVVEILAIMHGARNR